MRPQPQSVSRPLRTYCRVVVPTRATNETLAARGEDGSRDTQALAQEGSRYVGRRAGERNAFAGERIFSDRGRAKIRNPSVISARRGGSAEPKSECRIRPGEAATAAVPQWNVCCRCLPLGESFVFRPGREFCCRLTGKESDCWLAGNEFCCWLAGGEFCC
jgi:hypothetical protein